MSTKQYTRTSICALIGVLFAGSGHALPLPPPPTSPTPVVNYEYDAEGNPTKVIQAPGVSGLGLPTQSSYDALNRRKTVTDAKAGVTQFEYNGREDLTKVTDPRNLVTQSPRNGLGDVTSLISPDTGTAVRTFDLVGNLQTRTDSRGVVATYAYDALNRLRTVRYKGAKATQAIAWTYDQSGAGFSNGIGRLTSTASPSGSTQHAYDPQGRLLVDTQRVNAAVGANTQLIERTVTYGYDSAGHQTSLVYPSGRQLHVTYTGGKPSSIALAPSSHAPAIPLVDSIQWEPFGGVKSWQWRMVKGPQSYERVRDESGRLVRYRLGDSVRDVTYDAADRIVAYTHYDAGTGAPTPALDQAFGYDDASQLTGITTAAANWSISYDANGNRTSVTLNGVPSTYVTSPTSNQLMSITNPARTFQYDSAGNTTSDSAKSSSSYNLIGQLETVMRAGIVSTYSYDAFGRRSRKFSSSGPASAVLFVYDQEAHLLGEYDSAGNPLREYVWLGSTPVAMFTTIAGTATPQIYYFHTDHLDTPRVVVDRTGGMRWRWLADPFGVAAPETNPSNLGTFTQNLRFPGQYEDQETGLNYNYFRYYDRAQGRYTQSDPIGLAGGINTFSYADNDSVSAMDPLGLTSSTITVYAPVLGPFGPGGSLIFGTNPNGTGFMTFRLGIGLGGGFKIDPEGKRPGYDEEAGCEWGAGWSSYAGADFNAGPIYASLSATRGVNSSPNGPQFFQNQNKGYGARMRDSFKFTGINMTGALATQFTVFGGGSCACKK